MSHRKSTADALNRYFEKQLPKVSTPSKPRKKNSSPEKLVEKDVRVWAKKYDLDLDVVDASTYDRITGRSSKDVKIHAGFSDLVGNDRFGFAVFIELKAKGKRSTLKRHQYDFLLRKINSGAFGCHTDSVDHLHDLYHKWIVLKLKTRELRILQPVTPSQESRAGSKELLIAELPKKFLVEDEKGLFD